MRLVPLVTASWVRLTVRSESRRGWTGRTRAFKWVAILLGFGLYATTRVAGDKRTVGMRTVSAATLDSTVVITATNYEFHPSTVTIPAGTTVAWVDTLGNHTIEMDDKSFVSKPLVKGMRDTHRFDKPGKFEYHCQLHGDFGLVGMSGTIVVTPR